MLQGAVAHRIDGLEALTGRGLGAGDVYLHEYRSAFDADALRGHADPGVSGSHELFGRARPFGIGVDAATDVEPLDDDIAAELRRIRGRAHEHTGSIRSARFGREPPAAVARR